MEAERPAAERLLRPRSVAFVGGSLAPTALELCRDGGFTGPIWAVHPTREQIAGERLYSGFHQLRGERLELEL